MSAQDIWKADEFIELNRLVTDDNNNNGHKQTCTRTKITVRKKTVSCCKPPGFVIKILTLKYGCK